MRHESGVDNSSQSSIHFTHPVPRHALSAVTLSNLQNFVSFKIVSYDLYTGYSISESSNTHLVPSEILCAAAVDSRGRPSSASSLGEYSTRTTSVTSDRCVVFAPRIYRERSGSDRLTIAL
jgi:hypothetical protein